jgi:hypothetical protein
VYIDIFIKVVENLCRYILEPQRPQPQHVRILEYRPDMRRLPNLGCPSQTVMTAFSSRNGTMSLPRAPHRARCPGKGTYGHEAWHLAIVLDLVLDGVSVVREGLLKKLLDVVYRRPCQAPVAARDDQDVSHVEAARFPVTAIVMPGRGCRP